MGERGRQRRQHVYVNNTLVCSFAPKCLGIFAIIVDTVLEDTGR
jgi:hypothetical protein